MRSAVTYFGLFTLALVACSPEQNSVTSNIYHNLTAHFNGYYYAEEKAREVEQIILKSLDDDHNEVLQLFPKLDTTLAKTYEKETDEIVKMASISIQRHPNSKWVDDNYIMVGLARLYSCDFQNAIQTFKYVNTKSNHRPTRHRALIHLVRTFTEQGDYPKAEEAFRFLEKERLNKDNAKRLYLEKAYYYQIREDYDNMVRNLTQADSLFSRKDRKGRIYFIIGQVYQKLGFGSEAYNYYRKCLATNPEYEVDFYARLNMAQVARLDDTRDVKTVRNQFEKMLDDAKNREFRDKIYYELGEFERKQNHLKEAIVNYQLAAHAGTNKRIQGSAYLRLGQLHFDSLKKYSLAKYYYDSAVNALPPDFDNYEAIKKRKEILGEFATYTETIQWQDSLLNLSRLDSMTIRATLDSAIAKRNAEKEQDKKKRRRGAGAGNANQNNPFFQTESTATADWYFGNPSAVALGQSEFQRIWGAIPLEDNWRRSNKSALVQEESTSIASNEINGEEATATIEKTTDEVSNVFQQIPFSEPAKEQALAKIEDAYFHLGDLYYLQLGEKENAVSSYQTVLQRFPGSEFEAEILYKLFLIYQERKDRMADAYAERLKKEHPNSNFTKILLNPNFLQETSLAAERQREIYKTAYRLYEQDNLKESQALVREALTLGETSFTPQLELLRILITGKTESASLYQVELDTFMVRYPDHELKPYAQKLLQASKSFQQKMEDAKDIRYNANLDEPHFFIMVYPNQISTTTREITKSIERLIQSSYRSQRLNTSNLILNEELMMTMVTEFGTIESALDFLDKFTIQAAGQPMFSNFKFDTFVITKTNSDILYRTKALNEYLAFFDRNYQVKNQ
ncbi:MAG: tetratricopeptide repeat protein [Cyclobacteriaceae bacterium]